MRRFLGATALGLILLLSALVPAAAQDTGERLQLRLLPHVSIAILMFHQVTDHPITGPEGGFRHAGPAVTPVAFARTLAELQEAGYHFVTLPQALDFLLDRAPASSLPARPILLTFDDGFRNAWTNATPILERYHATATMFFEGHAVDNPAMPGRLSSGDLRAMARSGVWYVQCHGFAGHSDLTIGPRGRQSPYWYANLAWLPGQRRLETDAEYELRVQRDLQRFRTRFEPLVGHRIDAFAYPSGEYGEDPPLRPGENPSIWTQAGNSNAAGLTPYLFEALRNAGFVAAFAVSLPGGDHLAGRNDDPYAFPRIGVTDSFSVASLGRLESKGTELPEVAEGDYADPGPLAFDGTRIFVASTHAPTVFVLDPHGRLISRRNLPLLDAGRSGGPSAIAGMARSGDDLWIVQDSTGKAGGRADLTRLALQPNGDLRLVERAALPAAMSWLQGLAAVDGHLYGIDDSGTLFDVRSGRALANLAAPLPAAQRYNRFSGLAAQGKTLYTYDRVDKQLVAFTADGRVVATGALDAPVRDLAVRGGTLYASTWDASRRTLRRYEIVPAAG